MLVPTIFDHISIETSAELHPFDFDIHWDQGGARWSMEEVVQKIENIMFPSSNNSTNEAGL
jgi:hypothetical protein